jgi:putative spermidine/putrescine transport system permease protein
MAERTWSLATQHRRGRFYADLRAATLYGPFALFVIVFFVVPLIGMLYRSVGNTEVVAAFPKTLAAIKDWEPVARPLPSPEAFAALTQDISESRGPILQSAARRLNYELPGYRGILAKTARRLSVPLDMTKAQKSLVEIDPAWGQTAYWSAIKRNDSRFTAYYYLTALDLQRDQFNAIVHRPADESIFVTVFIRTFWISFCVTVLCLLIGYPLAYTMTIVPQWQAKVMMLLVLIPLWTSLLVRSIAWVVLLQREGIVNDILLATGLFHDRVRLVFNRTGLMIAMVHVLLPFMVLPIYSVMKSIGRHYMKAALSLGANPVRAFFTIYLPLSMPGVTAGSMLVFIVAVGYYITPELVGGGDDQMISHFIAYFTNQAINWGQAAALATILLVAVLALYAIYVKATRTTQLFQR